MLVEGMDEAVAEFEDKFNNGDGIVGYDAGFYGKQLVYVTKNPSQIKSATENIGTFDSGSNDIRFQKLTQEDIDNLPRC
jgi:hypothetical protein